MKLAHVLIFFTACSTAVPMTSTPAAWCTQGGEYVTGATRAIIEGPVVHEQKEYCKARATDEHGDYVFYFTRDASDIFLVLSNDTETRLVRQ